MIEKRKPLPVKEAIKKVMSFATVGDIEQVSLQESYGRYLAEDLIATHPVPPFDRSPYDGFAIRALDTVNAKADQPVEFEVIDEIGAGSVSKESVGQNQA